MTFKLEIAQVKADGTKNNIKLENSEALQNQSEMLSLLRAVILDGQAEEEIIELKLTEPIMKELKAAQPEIKPTPQPVINRIKQEPAEKVEVKKVSERETGVVEIHCPECGLQTAKHTPIKNNYFPCPTCETKLFLFALNEVRGEPNELGISFRANRIYLNARERWELKN